MHRHRSCPMEGRHSTPPMSQAPVNADTGPPLVTQRLLTRRIFSRTLRFQYPLYTFQRHRPNSPTGRALCTQVARSLHGLRTVIQRGKPVTEEDVIGSGGTTIKVSLSTAIMLMARTYIKGWLPRQLPNVTIHTQNKQSTQTPIHFNWNKCLHLQAILQA